MELTSPRLLLRPGRTGDLECLPRLLDWEVLKWFDFIHHPYGAAAARRFLQRVAEDHAGPHPGLFLLEERESGALIGEAWVLPQNDGAGHALGYWLGADHQGKGLGREAVVRIIDYAREDVKLIGLHANVAPQNQRSAGLLKSLGFVKVGSEPRPDSRAVNDHVLRWWLDLGT